MSARVGLVGYGLAGRAFHAPLIAAEPALTLAAIVTADPERRARARAEHPHAALLDDAAELWARRAELDLVVVASPNATHVPLARAAIEHGLDVVVDKPLAASADEAEALLGEARARGRLLIPFHNRRWDGDFLTVRRLVETGALGTVVRFESRFERWRPEVAGGWREDDDPAQAGGLLYDLGAHLVDQALQLFGPAAAVYAEVEARREGARVDDDVFVAITHAGGVRSHLWASMLAGQAAPRMRVVGDGATYVKHGLDPQEAQLRAGAAPGDPGFGEEPPERWGTLGAGAGVRAVPTEAGRYQAFYTGVVSALRGGALPVDPVDAIAGLRVIEAARRSARERRVVPLDDVSAP
ncbi:MAG: Gfo/Idh/MocA family oxidoreductase [Solirubrobacteraceae bacterium]|nr:Gfo/Idh/MocA family oxidoreductase [Solirubrobacteraceae bacterium]